MRRRMLLALAWLFAGESSAAGCSSNNCLRAVERVVAPSRNGTVDCISFFRTTVTPATTTIVSTLTSSTTSTRNVTATRNATSTVTAEPSLAWEGQNAVFELLRGIQPLERRQATAVPTGMPAYASPCSSLAAYSSACSCLNVSRVTVTATTPSTTRFVTSTAVSVTNATSTLWHNATSTVPYSSSITSSELSSTGASSTLGDEILSNILTSDAEESTTSDSSTSFSSATSTDSSAGTTTSASLSTFSSTEVPANVSTGILFQNFTDTAESSPTVTSTELPSNATGILFQNLTDTAEASSTFSSADVPANASSGIQFQNLTEATETTASSFTSMPATTGRFNSTGGWSWTSRPTASHRFNSTRPPFLNSTCTGFFRNSSSCLAQNTTRTIDKTCGETSTPFSVQVAQPGGLLDGWYLRTSGAGVLLTAEAGLSTRFAVEGSGHLCAVGKNGSQGNAAIAIINTLDAAGGPLWMVDANVTVGVEPRGYGDLLCEAASGAGGLACANGTVQNWVSCGLQLELTSLSGGTVEMDGRNCTALSLSVLGAVGNGTRALNGTRFANGSLGRGGGAGAGTRTGSAVLPTGAEAITGQTAAGAQSSGAEPGTEPERQTAAPAQGAAISEATRGPGLPSSTT